MKHVKRPPHAPLLPHGRINSALTEAVAAHMSDDKATMARLSRRNFTVALPPDPHGPTYLWNITWDQLARQGAGITAAFRCVGLEDMRVKGPAALFGPESLSLTRAGVVAYFALCGGAGAATLERAWIFSEGKAAALWLATQSRLAHGVIPLRCDMNTLAAEAFSTCTPHDQHFLLHLSVLESFTASQATFLSGEADAPERLRQLHDHNAFLNFDPTSHHYRLHNLFRAFLAEKLEADEAIDKVALYRRAGESLLRQGDPSENDLLDAARFFRRAGRDEDLLRLLELFSLPGANLLLLSADQIVPLALSVPWRLRAMRPVAWLAFVYFYFAECDPLAALPLLEEAETRFTEDPSIPAPLKRRLQGEAVLIRGILAVNDLWAMRDIHKAAHELLSGRSAIASRHMIWNFACPHSAYLHLREPGTYAAMIELIEGDLHYFHDLSDGCSLGAELLFRAERLLERGEFAEVESLLQAAEIRARDKQQVTVLLSAAFTRSRLLAALGKAGEAAQALVIIAPRIRALGHVDLVTCQDLATGYLHASLGSVMAIPAWLREDEVPSSRSVLQAAGFLQAVRGKAALAAGDYFRLDALARALPGSQGPHGNLFGLIHAKAQEAVAAWRLYGADKALLALQEALELARSDGIALAIAEYGAHVLPLLRMLGGPRSSDAHLKTVIRLAEGFPAEASPRAGRKAGLSTRQEAVLLLAAEGLNTAGMAARLSVSAETVKKTLSSAYAKLGAKNRAQAVRRFMEKD